VTRPASLDPPDRRLPAVAAAALVASFDAGGIVVSGMLYLYACDPGPGASPGCPVARAPLAQATSHDAWRVWDGSDWSADLTSGVSVIMDVPGDLSVSWNAYLGSYLSVHSVPLSNDVVYQTAASPQGPWSPEQYLFTGRHDASHTNYAAKEHPELARDGGRTLVVSYADAAEGIGSRIRVALPTLP